MTTLVKGITTAWVAVPEAGTGVDDNFIMENTGSQYLQVRFGGGDGFHTVWPGDTIIRAGVNGAVEVSSPDDTFTAECTISGI